MIKRIFSLTLGLLLLSNFAVAEVYPEKKHKAQMRLIDSFLGNHHYQNALLDDKRSREILEKYIEALDYGKYFFTQADINRFKQYETVLDNFAHRGQLTEVFNLYNLSQSRRKEQVSWALERLKKPFLEASTMTLQIDREKVYWAKDKAELKKRWAKRLRNEWIVLRLSKKNDEKAREMLTKRYTNIAKRMDKMKSDTVFQYYANAVTRVYDPHTSYFSPRSSEDFDINMQLSLEGIGAQLTIEDELITIKKLIAGGPAIKSGELAANDQILGVAQGKDGPMEDVVGWRLDEAVDLIRGKRGTTVRLQIQKASNDEIVEVVLVRAKIKLEESAAKSKIKEVDIDGKTYRIGIIDLPSFYIDFGAARRGEKNYRSTTRDVKKLIKKLEKDGIDGLMIDLRNNGGGALAEATALTGLFVDKGPVVQVRRANGDIKLHEDKDGKTYYDGPLAVLINQNSASASEIFAGAIKDYGRGVILGEPTYGKGTVQSVIDLARFLPSIKDKIGKLKMTIAMFYRVNGSSTQLKGVEPDLFIPDRENYSKEGGERDEDHALKWQSIKAVEHLMLNRVTRVLPQLQSDYDTYNATNPMMQDLLSMLKWQKAERDKTIVSLDFAKRKARKEMLRDKRVFFKNAFRKLYGYPLIDAAYADKKDRDKTEEEKANDKEYKVDPVLHIATRTAADYVRLVTPKKLVIGEPKSAVKN